MKGQKEIEYNTKLRKVWKISFYLVGVMGFFNSLPSFLYSGNEKSGLVGYKEYWVQGESQLISWRVKCVKHRIVIIDVRDIIEIISGSIRLRRIVIVTRNRCSVARSDSKSIRRWQRSLFAVAFMAATIFSLVIMTKQIGVHLFAVFS